MTTIIERSRFTRQHGFTLTELMISTVILGLVLAGAAGTLFTFTQGSHSLVNYVDMNTESRTALELFGRDVRGATSVSVKDEEHVVMLTTATGGAETTVEYKFEPSADTLYRVEGGISRALLNNVQELEIKYFDLRNVEVIEDSESSGILAVKHIQLEAVMQQSTLKIKNTNHILSARFMLRNKDVSE